MIESSSGPSTTKARHTREADSQASTMLDYTAKVQSQYLVAATILLAKLNTKNGSFCILYG
jgi:hypothetical protein